MGGSGFVGGIVQGMQQAQDRQMQFAELKLRQDHSKALMKSMEAEDQMKQLQLQSLQRKIDAETRLPSMQANVLGVQPVQPLGEMEQGAMPVPNIAPEIDRHKLVSLLQVAKQAGQPPDEFLQLMAISDPRIQKIRESLMPETFSKLGEGDTLVSNKTKEPVATGKAKTAKPPDFGDRTESAAAVYGQHKYGQPMTFTELLTRDPIEAAKIRQQTMVDEPATIAAGKIAATIPERKQELLTPSEANELGVPFGTTKGQAEGIMPMTAVQRKALASYDTSRAIIADIQQYSDKVNTAAGGLIGTVEQSMKLWGAWTQSNPDAALLQSKAGELSQIAKSLGDTGALANQDIARAAALVPGAMDTREVAQLKVRDMMNIIDQGEANFRKSLGIDARAPGKPSKAQPIKTPPPDPLAHIKVPDGLTPKQQQVYSEAYAAEKAKKRQQMTTKKTP